MKYWDIRNEDRGIFAAMLEGHAEENPEKYIKQLAKRALEKSRIYQEFTDVFPGQGEDFENGFATALLLLILGEPLDNWDNSFRNEQAALAFTVGMMHAVNEVGRGRLVIKKKTCDNPDPEK